MSFGRSARAGVLFTALLVSFSLGSAAIVGAQPLDPRVLTKYLDPLPRPGVMQPTTPGGTYYEVGAYPITQQLHSQLPHTYLWGYGTSRATAGYPAATFEVTRGVPIQVKWTNNLVDDFGNPLPHPLPVDQTLHWADPLGTGHSMDPYTGPVPLTTHVHGSEVEPQSDGGPDSWFTPGFAIKGPGWMHEVYQYVNDQPPATIWYHDHALGITRHNVYMGLAGFYIIRDPGAEPADLPSGEYEIPVVIQDRLFDVNGQLMYPNMGVNPEHPYWVPEFFGNVILVNGKVWPYLDVQPRKYRFRFLNGSNARFYGLKLVDALGNPGPAFSQIGTDGGYLASPVTLNDPANPASPRLLLAPGERADIVIDFAGLAPGTRFILDNNARAPYPKGATVDPRTTGQIMEFRVVAGMPDGLVIPTTLNTIPALGPATVTRNLTLNEVMGMGGPLAMFLDGKMWDGPTTEMPVLGSTEIWEIVNLTADTHPMHLHLVQFQLLNRQRFNVNKYLKAYNKLNPVIPADVTYNPPIALYLQGAAMPPDPNERGWKDTIRMNPGEVTRIVVRFAPVGPAEVTPYSFDATAEPGYVWHCHIIEHEDNEMMRRYQLVEPPAPLLASGSGGEALAADARSSEIAGYRLEQNEPNPFHPATAIRFRLPEQGPASLRIYNVLGQTVRTLADGVFPAGEQRLHWDGKDEDGRQVPSGLYFYRLESGGFAAERRMLLLQ